MPSLVCSSPDVNNEVLSCIVAHAAAILDLPIHQVDHASSFTELGGHSILAYALEKACRRGGIGLSIASILQSASIEELARLATMTPVASGAMTQSPCGKMKRSEYEAVKDEEDTSGYVLVGVERSPKRMKWSTCFEEIAAPAAANGLEVYAPLTEMQMMFLYGSLARPGSNIVSFYDTYETADLATIRDAWQVVIQKEPIFRCQLKLLRGEGRLVESVSASPSWTERVVSRQDEYQALLEAQPNDILLGNAFEVVTVDDGQYPSHSTIIWRSSHGLIDGYSAKLVYEKLRMVLNGQKISAGIPFRKAASKLIEHERESQSKNRAFWRNAQSKHPETKGNLLLPRPTKTEMPTKRSISSINTQFPAERLSSCARSAKVSLASIYYGAWALALSAFTDSDNVRFGAVLSGRNIGIGGAEDTVGPFINTLPLTVSVDPASDVNGYVRDVFMSLVDLSTAHCSRPEDGFTRDFASILSMQFSMTPSPLDRAARPVTRARFEIVGDIPISLSVWQEGPIKLDYHIDRYHHSDMERLIKYFLNALRLLSSHYTTMKEVLRNLMPKETTASVMSMSNATSAQTHSGSVTDDLVTLFERTVRAYGSLTAVEVGRESLVYSDLDAQVTHVASQLAGIVAPGDVVCVHADGSINWIVAIYGVLKAGATYSALDAKLPAGIRKANFDTAGAKAFLVPYDSAKPLAPEGCRYLLSVEELLKNPIPCTSPTPHRSIPRPSDNAYVCFTSGSTGKPKGVVCTHEGLVAFHRDLEVRMYAAPGCRTSQIMSPAFDGSIHEIFSTLSYGGTLVLVHSADPFVHLSSVQSAVLTPSMAKTLDPDDYPNLVNLYVVGEPLPQHVSDLWSSKKRLYNMYGPTEGTCGATIQRMEPGRPVTIGPPNPSTRLYILDRHRNLSPPGVVGEIYIAGVQVARGYIGCPAETAKNFLPDPFVGHGKERMYRTGDRGFWNKAGEVECLGRNDRMIKLRGFRLDLNDLEVRVSSGVPGVTAVAITIRDDFLVAMVQPASLSATNVRAKMAEILPPYAIPRHVFVVDTFPKTPVGKLDYKAIAEWVQNPRPTTKLSSVQLRGTESTIAKVWSDILGINTVSDIDSDSSFTSLGGHSILQLLQAERLRSVFSLNIPFELIVRSETLGSLARKIDALAEEAKSSSNEVTNAHQAQPLGRNRLSPLDREWWHKYQLSGSSNACFTVTYAASLDPTTVNRDRLAIAWDRVISRHDILRSRHVQGADGQVSREYTCKAAEVQCLDHFDLREEVNRPFDLLHESPIRVLMTRELMLVSLSHIICDYTTLHTLLQEMTCAYADLALPVIGSTFADTTAWSLPAATSDLNFWRRYLDNAPTSTFPSRKSYAGTSRMFRLPMFLCGSMLAICDAQAMTLHQLALAAVALTLSVDTDTTDIVLGGPFLNRRAQDLCTVGNFVEPLPIRITYPPKSQDAAVGTDTSSFGYDGHYTTQHESFLCAVRGSSQAALAHAINWSQLLSLLSIDSTSMFPNHPLLDVMVTVHDERSMPKLSRLNIPGAAPLTTWTEGAKFKLMLEFWAMGDDSLTLRVEYDENVVGGATEVKKLVTSVVVALEGLAQGLDYRDLKRRLRSLHDCGSLGYEAKAVDYFGRRMLA